MMFTKTTKILSPLTGTVCPMADLPDPVFASGMLGEAVGIVPEVSPVTLLAPLAGVVSQVSETGHAVGITSKDGKWAVLVHAGIDTVSLQGDGFTLHVREGERVRCGVPLLTMDTAKIEAAGYASTVVVVVTEAPAPPQPVTKATVQAGEVLFT